MLEVVVVVKPNVSQQRVLAAVNASSILRHVGRSRWEMEGCDHPPLLGTC